VWRSSVVKLAVRQALVLGYRHPREVFPTSDEAMEKDLGE
jgi:hypothetical protein